MSTYDSRLAALEKDVTVMKQDIVYKLDETNTVVTAILGVVGVYGRNLKAIDTRLGRTELQLEELTQDVKVIKEQQAIQGQDIASIKLRLDGVDQRLDGLDKKFDQMLVMLSTLTPGAKPEA